MGEGWRGYTDDPIAEEGHDLLDRARFARRVAVVLDDVRAGSESAVMSLVGPWGSGKTSLLRLVGGAMPEPWRVVTFNPWATADAASLIGEFFETIGSALPGRQGVRGAGEALRRYAQKVSPLLGAVPVAGQALAETADRAFGENTIEDRAGEVADRLREVGAPILVVIDDVDRLHPDELTEVFRAVRLLGRLPMLYYLLSYDERTVLDLLGRTAVTGGDEARARAYLEKIVQYSLDLPPILPVHLERMFTDGLDRLLDDLGVPLTSAQQRRIDVAWGALLSRHLTQPRAVQRYLARLATYLPLADPNEIDVADFALLTFLQQHVPETYAFLAAGRDRFTCRLTPGAGDLREGRVTPPVTDLGTVEEEQAPDGQRDVLRQIFALPHQRPNEIRRAYRERRAVVWDYFPRYFTYGVPATDLPDRAVRDGLRAICAGEETADRSAVEAAIGGPQQARLHLLSEDLTGADAYALCRHLTRVHPPPGVDADTPEGLPVQRWVRSLLLRSRGGPSAAAVVDELFGDASGWGELTPARLRHVHWLLDQPVADDAGAAWLDELRGQAAHHVLGAAGSGALQRIMSAEAPPALTGVLSSLSRRLTAVEAFDLLRRVLEYRSCPVEWATELLTQSVAAMPADELVRRLVGPRFEERVHLLLRLVSTVSENRNLPTGDLWNALARCVLVEFGRVPFDRLRRVPVANILSHALFDGHVPSIRAELVEAINEGRLTLLDLAAHFIDHLGHNAVDADRLATRLFGFPSPNDRRLWEAIRREAAIHGFTDPEPPGDPATLAGRRALAFRAIMSIDGLRERWQVEGFGEPSPAVT